MVEKYGCDPRDIQNKRAPGGGLELQGSDGLCGSTEECLKEEGNRTDERILGRQGWSVLCVEEICLIAGL